MFDPVNDIAEHLSTITFVDWLVAHAGVEFNINTLFSRLAQSIGQIKQAGTAVERVLLTTKQEQGQQVMNLAQVLQRRDALQTIKIWPSVRRGEEVNIFPFQEQADVMFNSALIYEMAVLRRYAEPLLAKITPEYPEYLEARRLTGFLRHFRMAPPDLVPATSILREFIG